MDAFELPLQQRRNIVDNLTRLSGAEPVPAKKTRRNLYLSSGPTRQYTFKRSNAIFSQPTHAVRFALSP
jgi:hypothetical protein